MIFRILLGSKCLTFHKGTRNMYVIYLFMLEYNLSSYDYDALIQVFSCVIH